MPYLYENKSYDTYEAFMKALNPKASDEWIESTKKMKVANSDPLLCEHPNIQFRDDRFRNGKRVYKHNWHCPDCGYHQIG